MVKKVADIAVDGGDADDIHHDSKFEFAFIILLKTLLHSFPRRHDTRHNDTRYNGTQLNDTQHEGLICDTQHEGLI